VSLTTQRLAVSACHEWFQRTHAAFTRDYRMSLPPKVDVVFGTSHNTGSKTFQLPQWVGCFSEPMDRLEHNLADHWDRHGQPFIDSLAYPWSRKLVWPIVTVIGVMLLLALCTQSFVLAFVVALLAGGIWTGAPAVPPAGLLSVLSVRWQADSELDFRSPGTLRAASPASVKSGQ
jgi:hypothetical protein